jgi:hypothetical protein
MQEFPFLFLFFFQKKSRNPERKINLENDYSLSTNFALQYNS